MSNYKKIFQYLDYLVQDVQELLREAEQEPREQHRLDVGDELRLPHQTVQSSTLLQALTEEENMLQICCSLNHF